MTAYPKRLIEVDLPIKRISAHARREKSIRHGHISTLHIWWARRPLAACRAVIAYQYDRGWAMGERRKGQPWFGPDFPPSASRRSRHGHRGALHRGEGRAAVGEIALTSNEYKTAERLKKDYWLYAVFKCAAEPKVHLVQDPARLG